MSTDSKKDGELSTNTSDSRSEITSPPELGAIRPDSVSEELLVQENSTKRPTLTIVMPTLNEEEGIAECIERAKSAIDELGVTTEIIVSDSSTDRTPEIASELGAKVVVPDESGYGNAYRHAFRHARGEYIAMGDADTTYDFEELPKLVRLASQNDVDIAMGTRLNGEIKSGAMPPLHQYIGNPLLTQFLNAFYDAGVTDAHSGFRVLNRDALERLELKATGMEFASEMIMDAAAKDMNIEERPITYHEREGEATLDSFRDGWRHLKFMLVNAPTYLFTVPAVFLTIIGTTIMTLSLSGVKFGGFPFGIQTMVVGSLLTLSGVQIGSLVIFSSVATDPIREPSDPITNLIKREFKLEHGIFVSAVLITSGIMILAYAATAWAFPGIGTVPSPSVSLLSSTFILVGVQTVFCSFFLCMLNDTQDTAY